MRIFLIGFPGSGKSAMAVELSALLGWKAIDLDKVIESVCGKSIAQIFEEDGEDVFRNREHEALKYVIGMDEVVISTGGGTPCFFDNMERMRKDGVCIYLKASREQLYHWLSEDPGDRPLIRHKSGPELHKWIDETLSAREHFYLQSQHIVATDGINAQMIKELLTNSGI
jgi:shikimate kinase